MEACTTTTAPAPRRAKGAFVTPRTGVTRARAQQPRAPGAHTRNSSAPPPPTTAHTAATTTTTTTAAAAPTHPRAGTAAPRTPSPLRTCTTARRTPAPAYTGNESGPCRLPCSTPVPLTHTNLVAHACAERVRQWQADHQHATADPATPTPTRHRFGNVAGPAPPPPRPPSQKDLYRKAKESRQRRRGTAHSPASPAWSCPGSAFRCPAGDGGDGGVSPAPKNALPSRPPAQKTLYLEAKAAGQRQRSAERRATLRCAKRARAADQHNGTGQRGGAKRARRRQGGQEARACSEPPMPAPRSAAPTSPAPSHPHSAPAPSPTAQSEPAHAVTRHLHRHLHLHVHVHYVVVARP